MKLKKSFAGLMLAAMVLSAPASVILSESTVAIATTVVDNDFNTKQNNNQNNTVGGFLNKGEIDEEDQAVGDMLKGQRGFTSEQLAEAGKVISPVTNIIGYLTGGVVVIIMSLIFLMTALDLLYIAIPPVRGFLNTDQSGATTGYGGMGGEEWQEVLELHSKREGFNGFQEQLLNVLNQLCKVVLAEELQWVVKWVALIRLSNSSREVAVV